MKRYFTLVLMILAVEFAAADSFYDQLCRFNPNWKKYETRLPVERARYLPADKQYIQAHLGAVLAILRSNAVGHLSLAQYRSRIHMLALLDAYRIAGRFPVNYYRQERIPVFIDEHDTHCAVGYLLQQTGFENIARRIAAADNYVWVKDIHDAGLIVWQQSSGLSIEELKLVQGAYDFYMPNGFYAPNKFQIPQKPGCMEIDFTGYNGYGRSENQKEIWCKGEGVNGMLNGKWIQNFAPGIPWITGYYENGKRSGQWQEYYQGTFQLCRTENWRDDKLNGVRRRFNRQGILIEEIVFKDGNAVTKTNYSLADSLTWIRKPLDSNLVWTEVYTAGGGLIAAGHEKIHNPGNLLWFQNIELTALNTIAVSARSISTSPGFNGSGFGRPGLFAETPLVQYNKEGAWIYYKECDQNQDITKLLHVNSNTFIHYYPHFGEQLLRDISIFKDPEAHTNYDSIRVVYNNNSLQHFYGFGRTGLNHLQVVYQDINTQTKQRGFDPEQGYTASGASGTSVHTPRLYNFSLLFSDSRPKRRWIK